MTSAWDARDEQLSLRERLAELIATIISGSEDAAPEQEDFDLADECRRLIKRRARRWDSLGTRPSLRVRVTRIDLAPDDEPLILDYVKIGETYDALAGIGAGENTVIVRVNGRDFVLYEGEFQIVSTPR